MGSPQVITNGVDYLYLIIPVVVALFSWIGAVYWADAHPGVRHVGGPPGPAISGQSAESALAERAADEHHAGAGQRIAASEDATRTGPGPTEAAQTEAAQTEAGARSGETGSGSRPGPSA